MSFDEIKSWMSSKGYELEQSVSGYYYCTHNDKDGKKKVVWMDSACEDAYDLESATFVAYYIARDIEGDDEEMSISNTLLIYMKNNGITQKELSKRCNISECTMSRFFRGGSIGTDKLNRIVSELGIELVIRKR